jgi:hypothetical protein
MDDLKVPKFDKDNANIYYGADDLPDSANTLDEAVSPVRSESIGDQADRAAADDSAAVERRRKNMHSVLSSEDIQRAPLTRYSNSLGEGRNVMGTTHVASGPADISMVVLGKNGSDVDDMITSRHEYLHSQGREHSGPGVPDVMSPEIGPMRTAAKKVIEQLKAQGYPEHEAEAAAVNQLGAEEGAPQYWLDRLAKTPPRRIPIDKSWEEYEQNAPARVLKSKKP